MNKERIAILVMFILTVMVFATKCHASPYFRPIDISHPQPVVGALFSPSADFGTTEAASLLPLITHSPKDGCLLPSIVCEDWTPLAVGASINAGNATFDVAPLANIVPWIQSAVQSATGKTYVQNPIVTVSAGPVWEYQQRTNKGYYKTFVGFALHF